MRKKKKGGRNRRLEKKEREREKKKENEQKKKKKKKVPYHRTMNQFLLKWLKEQQEKKGHHLFWLWNQIAIVLQPLPLPGSLICALQHLEQRLHGKPQTSHRGWLEDKCAFVGLRKRREMET